MSALENKSKFLVQANDIAWKISQPASGIAGKWNVHAMNGGDPSRFSESIDFRHNKSVVIEKLVVVTAVAQIALT
jgi:hypothetical protein